MKLLQGKTALVTGASKGIGRSIALKYAEQGANVAFTYLSSVEQGQALEAELAAKGIKAMEDYLKNKNDDCKCCIINRSYFTQHTEPRTIKDKHTNNGMQDIVGESHFANRVK